MKTNRRAFLGMAAAFVSGIRPILETAKLAAPPEVTGLNAVVWDKIPVGKSPWLDLVVADNWPEPMGDLITKLVYERSSQDESK